MGRQNKVRKLINLDIKKEIISKRECGKSVGYLNLHEQCIQVK